MNTFRKFISILALVGFLRLDCTAQAAASTHLMAHVSGCIDHDATGDEIKTCFLSVVRINANGEAILPNGFADTFYLNAKSDFNFKLPPGTYRVSLYVARSLNKPAWIRNVTLSPGQRLDLGEIDSAQAQK